MALISAKTIITSLSLFHITLGYFFLTSPITVADQALVWVLGEAMGMPFARAFDSQSPSLAFLAVMLAFVGITDLVTLSLPDEICLVHHWGTQAPLRMSVFLFLVFYTFTFSASSPIYAGANPRGILSHPSAHMHNPGYKPATWGGDGLKNRVFFTFIFLELMCWFWVWVTLREERKEVLTRKAMRRRSSHGSHTLQK
ncbi:hypothetical protein MCOR27_007622 [Pyricularia oryzae]|uniref:Increased loss of mitochondrial DNA protein 1 n=5 Tax=Pyricularia TaxID=48558 RepID=A0ABQ8NP82_PYRGI|nr:uncharacterized protein MGG_01972 [Pyricularia oryzae 70-15]ELQ34402.1 hypothetical protein OOU_Y34scaffold00767g6 [Pyricularia oryzae Y34]KAH8836481.1 hypothetical protein MCOR01_011441 [Pyricularia oryzae]KAI6300116.1 hypothetical protein MCOR33_004101 [Pyricularia grisea]EHA56098.1 hypothetical protein MGG_01972 [Pyricularia oryzae 70-15]KAH9436268.1 hypothetical protein MCOR02_005173 [Pyricularia oryzae]